MTMASQDPPSVSADRFDPGARRPQIAALRSAPALTVELRGAIDAATLAAVDAALQAGLAQLTGAVRTVLIDMSAVEFISAAGLVRLLRFVDAAAARAAACTLVGGRAVARPVQVLGLQPLLPVFTTVAAARAAGRFA